MFIHQLNSPTGACYMLSSIWCTTKHPFFWTQRRTRSTNQSLSIASLEHHRGTQIRCGLFSILWPGGAEHQHLSLVPGGFRAISATPPIRQTPQAGALFESMIWRITESRVQWISEAMNHWIDGSMSQLSNERTNEWMDGWINGMVDERNSFFGLPLYWTASSMRHLFSQLLLLWAAGPCDPLSAEPAPTWRMGSLPGGRTK